MDFLHPVVVAWWARMRLVNDQGDDAAIGGPISEVALTAGTLSAHLKQRSAVGQLQVRELGRILLAWAKRLRVQAGDEAAWQGPRPMAVQTAYLKNRHNGPDVQGTYGAFVRCVGWAIEHHNKPGAALVDIANALGWLVLLSDQLGFLETTE